MEVLKAYVSMRIGPNQATPADADISGLTAMLTFCDGFSHCVDQRTTALPQDHPLQGTSGTLRAASVARNSTWAHVASMTLHDEQAKYAIQAMLDCLRDGTGDEDALMHYEPVP